MIIKYLISQYHGSLTILKSAFQNCNNFKSFNLESDIKLTIDVYDEIFVEADEGFLDEYLPEWYSLETLIISYKCSKIDAYVFYGCKILKNVTIIASDNALKVYSHAFEKCISLIYLKMSREITIMNGYSQFKSLSFFWPNLSTLYVYFINRIDNNQFSDCTKLTRVVLYSELTFKELLRTDLYIGNNAFKNCPISSLEIYGTIVGNPGFNNVSSIKLFIASDGNSAITNDIFANSQITNITIPYSYDRIHSHAFARCSKLEKVYIDVSNRPITISPFAFQDCPMLNYIKISRIVNQEILNTNNNNEPNSFENIITVEFTDQLQFLATMSSTGVNEFCNFKSLKYIAIPRARTIESNTFKNCISLRSIKFPSYLEQINDQAFINCISLESFSFPETVEIIKANAFQNCSSLKSVYFKTKSPTISSNCFLDCVSLSHISLPEKLLNLPLGCFKNCAKLSSIIIPKTVKSIGNECFYATSIECLQINPGCTIQGDAFKSCAKLSTIEFLENSIAFADSFKDCEAISSIVFAENVSFAQNAFSSTLLSSNKVSFTYFGTQDVCPETTKQTFASLSFTSINTTSVFSGTTICGLQSNVIQVFIHYTNA